MLLSTSYSASNAQGLTAGQLDPNQVYTTGNMVVNTPQGGPSSWVNGVYQDNLTCWAWGNPGYCGPNPIVRPGNNINFSYGLTNLYQMQAVASALPDSGSGLRVNGYNFGFTAKNGNGWDDGRVDTLSAYVTFYDPKGSSVFNKNYNLNYKFNWTSFSYSETFNTPFAAKDLGSVQYGFVGRDNNFWAGPYGPEINSVSFSLKYTVDPCATNVLSSPTCPGYLEALAKLNPPSTSSTVATVEAAPTVTATITNDPINPVSIQANTTTSTPSNPSPAPSSPTAVASSTPQASATAQATPTTQERSSVAGPSLSTILGIVRNEQSRIASVESAVVSQANEAASSLASSAQQQAQTVAAAAAAASVTTAASTSSSFNNASASTRTETQSNFLLTPGQLQSLGGSVSLLRPPTPSVDLTASNFAITASSPLSVNRQTSTLVQETISAPVYVRPSIISLEPIASVSVQQPLSTPSFDLRRAEIIRSQEVEVPKSEGVNFTGVSPIKDYLEERPNISIDTRETSQRTTEVKRNVADNEAAGGVTIAAIARQPSGYDLYMAASLRDAAFYAPKEVYRNQKVVDNQRVLRQLNSRSDRLHEEMVNAQYK